MGIDTIIKHGQAVEMLSASFGIAMTIWGWTIVIPCTDKCTLDKSKVRPYMLMRVILIVQLVVVCILCCFLCTAVCAMAAIMSDPDRRTQFESEMARQRQRDGAVGGDPILSRPAE